MKKIIRHCSLVAIVAFIAGFMVCQNTKVNKLNKKVAGYSAYYKNTEVLLDTLNQAYDWVDSYDPQDYYDSKMVIENN